jgi:hypothetical protein
VDEGRKILVNEKEFGKEKTGAMVDELLRGLREGKKEGRSVVQTYIEQLLRLWKPRIKKEVCTPASSSPYKTFLQPLKKVPRRFLQPIPVFNFPIERLDVSRRRPLRRGQPMAKLKYALSHCFGGIAGQSLGVRCACSRS